MDAGMTFIQSLLAYLKGCLVFEIVFSDVQRYAVIRENGLLISGGKGMSAMRLNYGIYPLVVGEGYDHQTLERERYGSSVLLKVCGEQRNVTSCCSQKTEEFPETAELSWESENPQIASVQNGLVHAEGAGHTRIRAFRPNGEDAFCEIYVIEDATELSVEKLQEKAACHISSLVPEKMLYARKVNRIHLNDTEQKLEVGSKTVLYALAEPTYLVCPEFGWESSDPSVAQIREIRRNVFGAQEAVVEAKESGCCEIIVSLGEKRAVCRLTVTEKEAIVDHWTAERTSLKKTAHTEIHILCPGELEIDQVTQLQPQFSGKDSVPVWWLSSEKDSLTVDQEGRIKAYRHGIVTVYCISTEKMKPEELAFLRQLSRERRLEEKDAFAQLLDRTEHAAIRIYINGKTPGQKVLRNLHIPEEMICSDSIGLLWNRDSLLEIPEFSHYRVSCRERGTAEGERYSLMSDQAQANSGMEFVITSKLGHTFQNLSPNTEYQFIVQAEDADDQVLRRMTIEGCTKTAAFAVLDVTSPEYGAVGDGQTLDTAAIQKAIDNCPMGGTVLLPQGKIFYSGALFLKSHMTFLVEGILLGSTDPADYPPIITRWEGWRQLPDAEWQNATEKRPVNQYQHASLLTAGLYDEGENGKNDAFHTEDITICGNGMINGNGFLLAWAMGPNPYEEAWRKNRPASPKTDLNVRGSAVLIQNARNVYLRDITIAYGASWTTHIIYCDHVTFDGVKIISCGMRSFGAEPAIHILNGDGIDPDSTTNMNVTNCFFTAGDDAVAVKSGKNREGNELAKPTAYLRVTDCASIYSKGGFCIGSEQSGGAHDILWQNLYVEKVELFGLWIKTSRSRGGIVEDIQWKDCTLVDAEGALFLESGMRKPDTNPAADPPELAYQMFENIRCTGEHGFGIRIIGLPDAPIHDIEYRGVTFEAVGECEGKSFEMTCGTDIRFEGVPLPADAAWNKDAYSDFAEEKALYPGKVKGCPVDWSEYRN